MDSFLPLILFEDTKKKTKTSNMERVTKIIRPAKWLHEKALANMKKKEIDSFNKYIEDLILKDK